MKYGNKDIKDLSDSELAQVKVSLDAQQSAFNARINERLNHPTKQKLNPTPTINPAFLELLGAINLELQRRK